MSEKNSTKTEKRSGIVIKQEVADIFYEDELNKGKAYPKKGNAKGIKKYHINRNGTARENPEWRRHHNLPYRLIKKKVKFDVEVDRLVKK